MKVNSYAIIFLCYVIFLKIKTYFTVNMVTVYNRMQMK